MMRSVHENRDCRLEMELREYFRGEVDRYSRPEPPVISDGFCWVDSVWSKLADSIAEVAVILIIVSGLAMDSDKSRFGSVLEDSAAIEQACTAVQKTTSELFRHFQF